MRRFDTTEFIKVKHGRITILEEVETKNGVRYFLCQCDCGKVWSVALPYLKSGRIKSCGCYREDIKKDRTTHGMARRTNKATEYKIWASMIQRCTNPHEEAYKHYGGRGIIVCERWRQFENFLADMGKRPSKAHTLERKEVNGNYEPNNCIWATIEVQAINKRNTVRIEFNGKTLTVGQWAKEMGVNYRTLKNRFKNPAWTIEKALTEPIRNYE